MKKSVLLVLAMILMAAGLGSADVLLKERVQLDLVVFTWIEALQSEDIDLFEQTYWPDVVHTSFQPDGRVNEVIRGRDALMDAQREAFRQNDTFADIVYSDPDRDFSGDPNRPVYTIVGRAGEWVWEDIFRLEKRRGQWRIVEHLFVALP